ncbi:MULTISPECIES: restriction endonuclease [Acinetobacter calcoaceticus/baumannii complex]|uniref:restriction endonuclease n=1 Tax=Acinetobacter calcoaceticus/baumannii complex TaxID=909768 RepID=UPI002449D71D|nr:restriction endonuclease [Acinetobacter baumannii]MDH2481115.1 restriction endonuclease [Acinetobacter baumannii]MDH2502155.1 restriction endonuclease [Acinetobacter baumannii]MDV7664706.1 restriction endonuclease [Acinetobacter baumannii]
MIDFTELSNDGQGLELLVRELLFSMQYKVSWSGKGADGGRDLICVEEHSSIFLATSRKWLIQCKHKAVSGNSVGLADLDDIVSSCLQHGCNGYLLVTSTQPSSGVVARLEGITSNPDSKIVATYWDSTQLERRLRTAQQWSIAQHFFPVSAKGWQIFASDRPNHWTANFKGHYFHITNRIGSNCTMYLNTIENRINELEAYPLPEKHLLCLRSVYYDDKSGTFIWYIDYLYPHDQSPIYKNKDELLEILDEDWRDNFDIKIQSYIEDSDHYDPNHYDFYNRYMGQFILGISRTH